MRRVTFTPDAFREYNEWMEADPEIIQKIILLLRNIQNTPFTGLGKPEPLKGAFSGYWSRRITHEHRLIYKITNTDIEIIKCRGHYQ
ncbi:Txe/YoeB family addiction module toxin [Nemorincola caseinilytica]|uniref:Putative mRNA interferase YoeB n=1 Tax=Nemorincola caseinilytica TaxID=2054315 RepID=A0ABP8NPY9_9BACT